MSCYRFSEGFCKDHLMVYFHFKRRFESLCSTICILHSSIKSPDYSFEYEKNKILCRISGHFGLEY